MSVTPPEIGTGPTVPTPWWQDAVYSTLLSERALQCCANANPPEGPVPRSD